MRQLTYMHFADTGIGCLDLTKTSAIERQLQDALLEDLHPLSPGKNDKRATGAGVRRSAPPAPWHSQAYTHTHMLMLF